MEIDNQIKWTDEKTEMLVDFMSTNECHLWETTSNEYSNRDIKVAYIFHAVVD